MNRPLLLLPLGLLAALLAFGATSWIHTRTTRSEDSSARPELAWLRQEFRLSGQQFDRVIALHEAYQPTCATLCRRIAEQNERLRAAVAGTNTLTDDIRTLVAETGRVRDECRQAMLAHLYAVAREMPPDEGPRYLQRMLTATCVVQEGRTIESAQRQDSGRSSAHAHHD